MLALLQARGRLEERDLAALRWVLFAGEVFPTTHRRTLMEKLPHPRYANLYGPTETNVCAYYEVEPLSPEQTAPILIGKAYTNTDLIPINAEGKRVVTTNEEGLLYARGSTVVRGSTAAVRPPRRVSSPTPLRGPRQPTMDAGLVFDAWVSYGRCDLADENRPMRKLDSQKCLNHPGLDLECSIAQFTVVPAVLGNVNEN